MNPRLLVDMNLTPEWVPYLASNGIESVHWSNIRFADRARHRDHGMG